MDSKHGSVGTQVTTARHGQGSRWMARWVDHEGNERSKAFDCKAEAQNHIGAVTSALTTGTYADPKRASVSFGVVAEEWFTVKAQNRSALKRLKRKTVVGYRRLLDVVVLPKWGDIKLKDVEHDAIQAWVWWLATDPAARRRPPKLTDDGDTPAGLSAARVIQSFQVLDQVLMFAVRKHYIAANPADGVDQPRKSSREDVGRTSSVQSLSPGANSGGRASGQEVGPQAMRARLVSSLLRQKAPPLAVGVVVAASFIVVETFLVYLLKVRTPGNACGVFYLLGVLVVSTVWGFGLAVRTSLASAVAFAAWCSWPAPFMWAEPDNLVMITTFLVVALSANCLAYVARARAVEADQRRREAEATNVELTASRVRIVAAADDARRRLERDLRDGAQQRLVSLGLELRAAEASVPADSHPLREQISDIVTGLAGVSQDLQEISRGIHPAIPSKGGLGPALKSVARRSAL
jgi:hypothetical protein